MNVSENAVSVTIPSWTDEIASFPGVPVTPREDEPRVVVGALMVAEVTGVPVVAVPVVIEATVVPSNAVEAVVVVMVAGPVRPPGFVT